MNFKKQSLLALTLFVAAPLHAEINQRDVGFLTAITFLILYANTNYYDVQQRTLTVDYYKSMRDLENVPTYFHDEYRRSSDTYCTYEGTIKDGQRVVESECRTLKGNYISDYFANLRKKLFKTEAEKEAEYLAEVQPFFEDDSNYDESEKDNVCFSWPLPENNTCSLTPDIE